jgi:tetratricopeptide (TPR) repeat protein
MKIKLKHAYFITALILLFYFFLAFDINFCGPDEPVYFAYTKSLVDDGDLNIVNQVYNDYGQFVSPTYNLPDFHNHGGVVLWAPFYAYGKLTYSIGRQLNIASISKEGLENTVKCAMSFSTIIFAFFTLVFTFLLCRKLFSDRLSLCSTLLLFFATPFAYFSLFETGNGQIAASMLLAIALFMLYSYAASFKKHHWFLLGTFLSVCLAMRVELWAQLLFFIIPYLALLCLSKRIRWSAPACLILGLLPVFVLRSVNAYLKFGTFHPDELFFINSILKFRTSYRFNGLFSSFRGIIYSSPIILICLAGAIASVFTLIKKSFKKQEGLKDLFLAAAAVYLFLKLYSLSGIFSPSGDGLSGRCLLGEFPIFVILCGLFLSRQKGWLCPVLFGLSVIFLIWNLMITAEYIAGFDWLYVSLVPGLGSRLANLQYLIFPLLCAKDVFFKCVICLPLAAIISGLSYLLFRRMVNYRQGKEQGYLRAFSCLAIILATGYLLVTLLNLANNRVNAQRFKNSPFLKNARIVQIKALALSQYDEEERLWSFYKERAYYALKGDLRMMQAISCQKELVFGNRPRLRQYRLPIQIFRVHPAFYNTGARYKQAIECYEKAVSLDPQDFEACISLGDIYSIIGKYQSAIESYKKALSVNPDIMRLYFTLGDLYGSLENFDMAVSYYQQAIARNPSLAEAYKGLAAIYNLNNDYNRAIIYYQKYLELNPRSAEASRDLAQVYAKNNDYPKQIESLVKALELNPRSAETYSNLAEAYGNLGDYSQEIVYYKKYLELNPRSVETYSNLAEAYGNLGDYSQEIVYYKKYLELNPGSSAGFMNLAQAFGKVDDYMNEIKCLDNVIRLNPQAAEAYRNLADIYRDTNKYNKAITYYQKYLELNPRSSESYNSIADMYRKVSNFEKALDAYARVISLKPNDPWVYFDLGQTYNTMGQQENVLRQVEMLKKLSRQDLAGELERSLRKQ